MVSVKEDEERGFKLKKIKKKGFKLQNTSLLQEKHENIFHIRITLVDN